MILSINEKILLEGGEKAIVKKWLGAGAQGEVYLVSVGTKDYALKWYFKQPSPAFIQNLRTNIHKGSPSEEFLWPLKLAEQSSKGIGYLMDLRPERFHSFVSFLNGKVRFQSASALSTWCLDLANGFKILHSRGYSYQDLNDGSFFLDPITGEALICDNDNVAPFGANLGIMGKVKYMAPEVLRGEVLPDTHTDRFSLAVILFMALTYGHPFQGEYLRNYPFIDEVAEMELYGTKPLFIFDPKNTSNRPIRGYHNVVLNYWPQTPSYLQQEFIKTFTEGLLDRENGRTTEIRWVRLFQRYRDELVVCPHCQFEYPNQTFPQSTCPKCKKQHPLLGKLTIHNNVIYLAKNKALYATHLDKTSSEYNRAVGKVIQKDRKSVV